MLHKTLFVARNRMRSFSIDEELNRLQFWNVAIRGPDSTGSRLDA